MSNYGQVYATAKMSSSKRNVARLEKQFMRKRTLKQRFKDWLFDDSNSGPNEDTIRIDEDRIELSRETSIRFEIHQASGGRVVQTRRYDARKDRNVEGLYIIAPEQDFGREIDKIITMEALRS
jgi:hypothetical protein